MGPVVDDLNVFNMPFVFRDEAHMRKVIDGPIGQEMLDRISSSPQSKLDRAGLDGRRHAQRLLASKPVRKPADLKGQKIRMMGNPMFVETMNAMGGNGIAMGFNELFSALQTGVVDGAENNPPTLLAQNHYTGRRKVYSLTGHLIIPEIFVFSKRTWDKLVEGRPGAGPQVLARGADRAARAVGQVRRRRRRPSSRRAGVQFVRLDKKAFYNATQPMRDKYGAKYAALMKRIEDTK